ncbi:MAG: DUF2127 domain-containing protein [Acidobacteria bacterium]|nr:DUF2127 domain-containing protein [Acidobacteriota bacterium]
MKRPFGVAVLAIIHFLEALLFLFTGAILWLFAQLVGEMGADALEAPDELSARLLPLILQFIQSGKMVMVYAVVVVFVLLFAAVGVGLWRLRPWARLLTLGLTGLRLLFLVPGLVVSVVQLDALLIGGHALMLFVYGWIVWYLFQAEVKHAFGV